ncbi:hypothetical protein PUNSTDRAFT_134588 [Punctularia strigosozonata HHB-11173 SS5]|uniref:uncharacterized protein n=1 Tax=Punctularia strigosozonata (strain HHB-11173) TaxID=741275 RepID=UPI00044185F3|nr:uncharacterized protein PUNSTDRAFT_134588 [Punctularia strigosozonata HHB-11173 SS5]EIN08197.1 hypothetical protein PUNSTDRAFT_134588 [Punctularia strigosozonata HHB-11173 SS5]
MACEVISHTLPKIVVFASSENLERSSYPLDHCSPPGLPAIQYAYDHDPLELPLFLNITADTYPSFDDHPATTTPDENDHYDSETSDADYDTTSHETQLDNNILPGNESIALASAECDTEGGSAASRDACSKRAPWGTWPAFPSLLSANPLRRGNPVHHARHGYPHRGHSGSSLRHLKSFWDSRRENWWSLQGQGAAYDGILHASHLYSDEPSSEDIDRSSSEPSRPPFTQEGIFPRMGDLHALKYLHCATVDYCFADFPAWTISKALFTWNVLLVSSPRFAQDTPRLEPGCPVIHPSSDSVSSGNPGIVASISGETRSCDEGLREELLRSSSKGWYYRWQIILQILGGVAPQQANCALSQSISLAISTSLSSDSVYGGTESVTLDDAMDLLDQAAEDPQLPKTLECAYRGERALTGTVSARTVSAQGDDDWWEEDSEEDYGVLLSQPSFGPVVEDFLRSWNIPP